MLRKGIGKIWTPIFPGARLAEGLNKETLAFQVVVKKLERKIMQKRGGGDVRGSLMSEGGKPTIFLSYGDRQTLRLSLLE